MKNWQFATLIATIVLCAALFAFGQSYGTIGYAPIAPTLASCPAGLANSTMLCTVGSAGKYSIYVSFNAGTYQLLVPISNASGVTTFNGRSGPVTLTKADVTAVGLAIATTVTSTANSTIQ